MSDIEPKMNYCNMIQKMKEISSYFKEEQSQKIFQIRYHALLNRVHFSELVRYSSEACKQKVFDHPLYHKGTSVHFVNFCTTKPILLYGAGGASKWIVDEANRHSVSGLYFDGAPDISFLLFDKNYETTKECGGFPVLNPEELVNYLEEPIFVTVRENNEEIFSFLNKIGFQKEKIAYDFDWIDEETQYFDKDLIQFKEDEIFVDAGVFDGSTSIRFAEKCPNYKKIYLFEPDEVCLENTKNNLDKAALQRYELQNKGLWHQEETVQFSTTGCPSIDGQGDSKIYVDTLDNLINEAPVTYIKMDIEGAELNSLKGAKNTIRKHKPKLAISLYHKPEDLFELPEYIKSLVPEYTFYLRHYSVHRGETVLYAIYEDNV